MSEKEESERGTISGLLFLKEGIFSGLNSANKRIPFQTTWLVPLAASILIRFVVQ